MLNTIRPFAERFPKLLMAYRLLKSHWQLFDEPVETPMGFRLIGNAAMIRGEFEVEETRLIGELLNNATYCINVGANIGYYCCLAASLRRRVIAFEPVALNLQYVAKNIEANGWNDFVSIVPVALSDRRGVARIYGGGTGASLVKGWANASESFPTIVPTSTLDEEVASQIAGMECLIIVDIEGAEKKMLDGARRVLGMVPKPIWFVEISVGEHQPRGVLINPELFQTFQVFWLHGYEAWTTARPYRRIVPGEVERIVSSGIDTLMTHNFLFVECGRMGCWNSEGP